MFQKTSISKCSSLRRARMDFNTSLPTENVLSTAAVNGRAVLYFLKMLSKGLGRKWIVRWQWLCQGHFQVRLYLYFFFFQLYLSKTTSYSNYRKISLLPCHSSLLLLCVFPSACSCSFSFTSLIIVSVITFISSPGQLKLGWKSDSSISYRSFSCGWNLFITL